MTKPIRSVLHACSAVMVGFSFGLSAWAEMPEFVNATDQASLMDLRGEWGFATETYRSGLCQMSGSLTVFASRPNATDASCSLTAIEVCGNERSVVEQSCQISVDDEGALIESKIEQFIERKPNSLGYLPDNFTLTSVNSSEMAGALQSAVSAQVIFRRVEGAIS